MKGSWKLSAAMVAPEAYYLNAGRRRSHFAPPSVLQVLFKIPPKEGPLMEIHWGVLVKSSLAAGLGC